MALRIFLLRFKRNKIVLQKQLQFRSDGKRKNRQRDSLSAGARRSTFRLDCLTTCQARHGHRLSN